MPERPKRRKNNKNKRKNKNNRPEGNKDASDVKEVDNIESCSNQNTNEAKIPIDNECVVDAPLSPTPTNNITSDDIQDFNEDLNNNTNSLSALDPTACDSKPEEIHNNHTLDSQAYFVESPEQTVKCKPKIGKTVKSKSLDNDDDPKIVEITDDQFEDSVSIVDSCNVVVSDVESDVEWEKYDELNDCQTSLSKEMATGTLTITTIPLNIAQCEQTKSLTPDEELSLRNYLKTLNLSTSPENINSVEIKTEIEQIINREIKHRLRKKGLAEDFSIQRLGPPRMLDVIDEEGSGESNVASRRQSYLSDRKSDNEDLDDEVFESKNKSIEKFSAKSINTSQHKNVGRLIPQQCVLVGAKLKEPEISEARGDWTVKTVEKMTGAEVVYLTDSSSSTSSLHDVEEDTDDGIETDVSVRMITPTIEVTDTEDFLTKTFISSDNHFSNEVNNMKETKYNNPESVERIIKFEVEKDNDVLNGNNQTETSHEIVVVSTDTIKTNLYVKELDECKHKEINNTEIESNKSTSDNSNDIMTKKHNEYDLEIKVIKCELNDAINNLIKEVASDSEIANDICKGSFTRQDSSSSVCSSQSTAKYNPTYSSLNDVSNIQHDESNVSNSQNPQISTSVASHVKDVFECVTGELPQNNKTVNTYNIKPATLKDFCVTKIASLPYGNKVLEELASVSERLQNINLYGCTTGTKQLTTYNKIEGHAENSPYYLLPDRSTEKVSLAIQNMETVPPPVKPRNSSLKKSQEDEHRIEVPTKAESVYVCLSPSQKMLMEKTNTVLSKEKTSELLDTEKKFIEHSGYTECHSKESQNEVAGLEKPTALPFKSQTGSRLLALIRDSTLTGNVNTLKSHDKNIIEQLQKKFDQNKGRISTIKDFSKTYKPIPPPRPRKISSSFYESDEHSDFADSSSRSIKSGRKIFHYSTGNLSKEIENDVSSIQNMHRFYTNMRDRINDDMPRRPSLPKDLCDQQMEYIRQKEKEVEAEIQRLENKRFDDSAQAYRKGPRAPLITQKDTGVEEIRDSSNYYVSRIKDICTSSQIDDRGHNEKGKISSLFSSSQEEIQRDKMYSEYVSQMAERQERKEHKIIKITNNPTKSKTISKSMPSLDVLESKINNRIEKEFISKARERWEKLGIKDPETEDERDSGKNVYKEPKVIDHKIKVIESGQEKDVQKLPSHLQEFVRFTVKDKEQGASSSGESESGPASPHVVILCAVIIIMLAIGKYFLRLLRNK